MVEQNNQYVLQMETPANTWKGRWREALPLGNGILGASVYGMVWKETIMLNHTDLWWKGNSPELIDVSDVLPQIRAYLQQDEPLKADRYMTDAFAARGYEPKMPTPLPVCDLQIEMPTEHPFKQYKRTLDMAQGEAVVSWQDGEKSFVRSTFVSRADDFIACNITEAAGKPFTVNLGFAVHDIADLPPEVEDAEAYLPQNQEILREDGYFCYAAQNEDGTDFGAVARVVTEGGKYTHTQTGLTLTDTTAVTVYIKIFIKAQRTPAICAAKASLAALDVSYEVYLQRHAALHAPLMQSTRLDLASDTYDTTNERLLLDAYQGEASLELLEKMWLYGRYLLIAASHEGGNPCQLYGLWCGDYEAMWAFNMVNENLQMMYWQALTGNMPQLLLAVFDYVDKLMDDFRENAKKLYGCRGIYMPAPTTPVTGLLQLTHPHILYWTGGAGWVGQHYYDYYRFTGDKTFLQQRAIPYLKEVALFYEDFFFVGEDGYYISSPSNSPENMPGNYWQYQVETGIEMKTAMNATMDFAIAKETLLHLIEGCTICGIEPENIAHWQASLAKIPPYQINEDGALKEWMHPYYQDNYHHRHQSHLYPFFPGNEIHKSDDPSLYEACVTAVKKRLTVGINQQTGWSLAHMANNYARMEESELALDCLDMICRACVLSNLMTLHNDWRTMGIGLDRPYAPIQLDANMGLSAAINEMLVQSYQNKILLLPALPVRFAKGAVEGLLTRAGVLVSIQWNKATGAVRCTLKNGAVQQKVTVVLPAFCNASCDEIEFMLMPDQVQEWSNHG
ncbi:MAG: glycoside hydrolase N-terminal domain-containing protein [Faecalibacterium sp.]